MPYPTYAIPAEVAAVNAPKLHSEITPAPDSVTLADNGSSVTVFHAVDPTPSEKTAIDAVVAAHDATPVPSSIFHAAFTVVEPEMAISSDTTWMDLGGFCASVGFFMDDATKAKGRLLINMKSSGLGAEVRVVKGDGGGEVVVSAVFALGDTAGVWQPLEFETNAPLDSTSQVYKLQGRLNGATSASVRFASALLLESS